MAQQPLESGKLVGLLIQGDIGDLTYYTSRRNRIVAFVKSPPLSPPTITQQHFRNLFRTAARAWRALPKTTRDQWARIARGAGLRATGFNLFIWYQRSNDREQLATFARLAGETMPG